MPNTPYNDPNGYDDLYRNGEYHKGDAPFQFPWWAILAGCVAYFPLGLIMIGVNSYLKKNPPKEKRVNTSSIPYQAPPRRNVPPVVPKAQAVVRQAADDSEKWARILLITGAVLACIGVIATMDASVDMAFGVFHGFDALLYLEDLFDGLLFLGGGLGALFAGWTTRTNGRMRKKIANIVGGADHMYIKDIAAAVPCRQDVCIRHLENCIDKGVFGEGAYLDMRTKCLVVRGPAPQPAPKATRAKAPPPPKKEEERSQYQQILDELRRVNDAIPDDEMSDKISRLETVSARIFRQVENNPEKLTQMRKFMDYYLPTSLKLLKTYAELDAQGVEGANIRLSKQRIEQAMNTLVVAFENQLDQLFSTDAMDVSTDIEVMENMLRADGLAGDSAPSAPFGPRLEL